MANLRYSLIALGVFFVDRATKALVEFGHRNGFRVFTSSRFFSLRYVRNPGGAFGLFPNRGYLFVAASAVAAGLITYMLFFANSYHYLTKIGLALLLGGSIGNLVDRLVAGSVVDFIQVGEVLVFNLADLAIVCGSGLIIFVISGGTRLIAN